MYSLCDVKFLNVKGRLKMNNKKTSDKKILITFILCLFLGSFGVHRFYVGRVKSGIFQLLTLGGLGFWAIYDCIVLALGKFTDSEDKLLQKWT